LIAYGNFFSKLTNTVKLLNFFLALLSLILALIILINVFVSRGNNELSTQLMTSQQVLSGARNNEIALRALTIRIAQGAVKDPAMKDILIKHQLRATIEVNGKQQEVP
jgi:hypothetical protein